MGHVSRTPIWHLHSQDSQHDGLACAYVCPPKTLDLAVKNRHLDPFTDQMICKLIALSPQGSKEMGGKKKISGEEREEKRRKI